VLQSTAKFPVPFKGYSRSHSSKVTQANAIVMFPPFWQPSSRQVPPVSSYSFPMEIRRMKTRDLIISETSGPPGSLIRAGMWSAWACLPVFYRSLWLRGEILCLMVFKFSCADWSYFSFSSLKEGWRQASSASYFPLGSFYFGDGLSSGPPRFFRSCDSFVFDVTLGWWLWVPDHLVFSL